MFERVQFVDRGRVRCPIRDRDVEVDVCLTCEALRGAHLDGVRPVVICVSDPRGDAARLVALGQRPDRIRVR